MKKTLKLLFLVIVSTSVWLGCSDDDDNKQPQSDDDDNKQPQEVYRGSCQIDFGVAGDTNLNCYNVFSKDELAAAEICLPIPAGTPFNPTVAPLNSRCSGTSRGSCSFSFNNKQIRQDYYNIYAPADALETICKANPINGTWTAAAP